MNLVLSAHLAPLLPCPWTPQVSFVSLVSLPPGREGIELEGLGRDSPRPRLSLIPLLPSNFPTRISSSPLSLKQKKKTLNHYSKLTGTGRARDQNAVPKSCLPQPCIHPARSTFSTRASPPLFPRPMPPANQTVAARLSLSLTFQSPIQLFSPSSRIATFPSATFNLITSPEGPHPSRSEDRKLVTTSPGREQPRSHPQEAEIPPAAAPDAFAAGSSARSPSPCISL